LNAKFITLFGKASSKINVYTTEDLRIGLIRIATKVNPQNYVDIMVWTKATTSKLSLLTINWLKIHLSQNYKIK